MKFSIVIPTLNEVKLLPNLLKQLNDIKLRDKYDYEIIISDGGSTDGTQEVALSEADKLTAHTEKTRQNISQGRNAGVEVAEGDWLVFLNGDVVISDISLFFEKLDLYCNKNLFAGITFAVRVNQEEEKLLDKIFLSFYNYYFHFLNIIKMGMSRGECMVISRGLFNELNGFNEQLFAGEDFDLFTRVRKHGKVKFIYNPVICESPRRYRKEGHFKILFTWLANSISVFVSKKSISKEWEEVR